MLAATTKLTAAILLAPASQCLGTRRHTLSSTITANTNKPPAALPPPLLLQPEPPVVTTSSLPLSKPHWPNVQAWPTGHSTPKQRSGSHWPDDGLHTRFGVHVTPLHGFGSQRFSVGLQTKPVAQVWSQPVASQVPSRQSSPVRQYTFAHDPTQAPSRQNVPSPQVTPAHLSGVHTELMQSSLAAQMFK